MIDMEKVLAYKTQQGYADCAETITEHDKQIRANVIDEITNFCKNYPSNNSYQCWNCRVQDLAEQLKKKSI